MASFRDQAMKAANMKAPKAATKRKGPLSPQEKADVAGRALGFSEMIKRRQRRHKMIMDQ